MRNFLRVGEVDPLPLLNAIARQPELWNQNTLRTQHPNTAHGQADDIWIWFNDVSDPSGVINDVQVIPYPAWQLLPQVREIVFNLMRRVEAVQLGRVLITRLAPGKAITPHVDGGAPATFYTRYQIALQSLPGVQFRAGEEVVQFRSGEVWTFDNTQEHEVINNSADDRIALIIDVRCA
jgi:hypothetical protein